jgi:hypothetical protein
MRDFEPVQQTGSRHGSNNKLINKRLKACYRLSATEQIIMQPARRDRRNPHPLPHHQRHQ